MDLEGFEQLVHLMYETESLNVLQKLYEWSVVGPDDVDDTRYTICKKLSEVWDMHHLSEILAQ